MLAVFRKIMLKRKLQRKLKDLGFRKVDASLFVNYSTVDHLFKNHINPKEDGWTYKSADSPNRHFNSFAEAVEFIETLKGV